MTTPLDLSDADFSRLETLVRETRQHVLDGLEQMLLRQADPLLERTRHMVLKTTETVLREQTEPLVARLREVVLQTTEEIVQRHAGPLVAQLRTALQQMLEEVVQRQMEPMLQRAKQSMQESTQLAAQFADALAQRLKVTLAQPAAEVLRQQVPGYAHWAGRRTLDYVLSATLFCLAAVFLLVGGVLGLKEAGVPDFASYLAGSLVAFVGGWVFLRLFSHALPARAKSGGPTP